MKRLLSTLSVTATLLVAPVVHASHDYPQQIRDKYKLGYCPDCTLCHATPECGNGAVTTDFGLSLMGYGAKGRDPVSLDKALDADRAERWDSDGDGVPDIDELVLGTDPSGPSLGRVAGAKYGCSVAGRSSSEGGSLVFAIFSCVALLRRARRAPHE
jgi:hypothetical protein